VRPITSPRSRSETPQSAHRYPAPKIDARDGKRLADLLRSILQYAIFCWGLRGSAPSVDIGSHPAPYPKTGQEQILSPKGETHTRAAYRRLRPRPCDPNGQSSDAVCERPLTMQCLGPHLGMADRQKATGRLRIPPAGL